MKKEIKDLNASIHAKLLKKAKASGKPFQEVLQYYASERFLYRLSRSQYCPDFILKGGLAFFGWGIPLRRPTKDIDFQGVEGNNAEFIVERIKEICSLEVEADGIKFDIESITTSTIVEGTKHEGIRVGIKAYLGRSLVWIQVDVSFANVITPKEILLEYQSFLDMPSFTILGYNRETAIAEKFQSMVFLGSTNGRVKDYLDIYVLAREGNVNGRILSEAIRATFDNRVTDIPYETPSGLQDDFAELKQGEWNGLLNRINHPEKDIREFTGILTVLRDFLMPPARAATRGDVFMGRWTGERWILDVGDDANSS